MQQPARDVSSTMVRTWSWRQLHRVLSRSEQEQELADQPLQLLDLPAAILASVIIGPGPRSQRLVCRAFRMHHDAGRTCLELSCLAAKPCWLPELRATLERLPHLTSLRCEDQLCDLSPLAACPSLKSIFVGVVQHTTTLLPLGALHKLEELMLQHCRNVTDIHALAECTNLAALSLSHCDIINDISALSSCQRLSILELSYCRNLEKIQSIGSCGQLTRLCLNDDVSLCDIQHLASCHALAHLQLHRCSSLIDINALAECHSLSALDLSFMHAVDVHPLEACPCLITVSLLVSLAHIAALDLAFWASKTSLQALSLCGVGDISGLALCQQLTSLYCPSGSRIRDVSEVLHLGRLVKLSIDGGQGIPINALAACTTLTFLQLCDFHDTGDLSHLQACVLLQELSVRKCYRQRLMPTDLGGIGACARLQSLTLFNGSFTEIASLASCGSLTSIKLVRTYRHMDILDINPLASCHWLASVSLNNVPVSNLGALTSCSQLTRLYFGDSSLSDMRPLAGCKALRSLYIYNGGEVADIDVVAGMSGLQRLVCTECPITSIHAVSSCAQLVVLSLQGCGDFEDLRPLVSCSQLQQLDLMNCDKVIDLRPLLACTNLRSVIMPPRADVECLGVRVPFCIDAFTTIWPEED